MFGLGWILEKLGLRSNNDKEIEEFDDRDCVLVPAPIPPRQAGEGFKSKVSKYERIIRWEEPPEEKEPSPAPTFVRKPILNESKRNFFETFLAGFLKKMKKPEVKEESKEEPGQAPTASDLEVKPAPTRNFNPLLSRETAIPENNLKSQAKVLAQLQRNYFSSKNPKEEAPVIDTPPITNPDAPTAPPVLIIQEDHFETSDVEDKPLDSPQSQSSSPSSEIEDSPRSRSHSFS